MGKEWEMLWDEYEDRWKTGRVSKDIWKYIPAKLLQAVTMVSVDQDGYWIYLDHEEGGWSAYDHAEDCGIIHEFTIAGLKDAIKTIKKC